jgi:hypothetical protein
MNIVLNQQLDNRLRQLPVEAGWSGVHLRLGHERIQGSVDGVASVKFCVQYFETNC